MLIGVLVGLFILLLIAAGVIAYRLASQHKATDSDRGPGSVATTTGGPGQPDTVASSQGAGSGQLVTIDCAKLRGRQVVPVAQTLESQGFQVTTTDAVGSKQPLGEVITVSPCKAHRGDTITLSVSPGRTGRPSTSPTPQQSPSCGTDSPITLCASGLPTGPAVTPNH